MENTIGKQIAISRKSKGLTQTELGEKVGVSIETIKKFEKGLIPKYKKDTIARIDKLLGTGFYALLYNETPSVGDSMAFKTVIPKGKIDGLIVKSIAYNHVVLRSLAEILAVQRGQLVVAVLGDLEEAAMQEESLLLNALGAF